MSLPAQELAKAANSPIRDWTAVNKIRAAQQAQAAAANTAKVNSSNGAKELYINPEHAYPPSCLNNPISLQYGLSGDPNALQAQVTLPGDPLSTDSAEVSYQEADTIHIWRVACSGGVSATLLEIDRPTALNGNTTTYPVFPGVTIQQGTVSGTPRLTDDPNTFFSNVFSVTPLINSNIYVLEYTFGTTPTLNYNSAMTVLINNFDGSSTPAASFSLPTYNPAQYAASSQPMQVNGYMSANWTSETQSGEGIVMQIYDNRDGVDYTLAFAWFTYDTAGNPYWLYGQAAFEIGDTQVSVPTVYFQGGSFLGTLAGGVPSYSWGVVQFSFSDCNTMNVVYNRGATPQGPASHGAVTFDRVANVNGIVCE